VAIDEGRDIDLTLWDKFRDKTPRPQTVGRDNEVGRRTSISKLNGVTYTPLAVARQMVAQLPMSDGAHWIDPACGDGTFMIAALEKAVELNISFTISGWDIDGDAVSLAEHRLAQEFPNSASVQWRVEHRDALASQWPDGVDAVVGNPPYLEAKRMSNEQKQLIKNKCPIAARGAFDLYAAFVELAVKSVKSGGYVSLIVPNRISVTNNAGPLRAWILEQGDVSLVDLSRDNVFPNAAVYPIVVTIHKQTVPARKLRVVTATGAYEFDHSIVASIGGRWPLPTSLESAMIANRICSEAPNRIGDYVTFKWTVSFHKAGLREQFVSKTQTASPSAMKFIGGGKFAGNREVSPGKIVWGGSWIDYDEGQARDLGNPLPPRDMFSSPKLVVCQNVRRARAAVDLDGYVLKDTFLLGALRTESTIEYLYWICIVMHSDVFNSVYECLLGGTRKSGGFIHFLGSYLEYMPVPPIPNGLDVFEVYRQSFDESGLTVEAEKLVRRAFDVSVSESAWIDQWVKNG
jgi:predicted RNA methylase